MGLEDRRRKKIEKVYAEKRMQTKGYTSMFARVIGQ